MGPRNPGIPGSPGSRVQRERMPEKRKVDLPSKCHEAKSRGRNAQSGVTD